MCVVINNNGNSNQNNNNNNDDKSSKNNSNNNILITWCKTDNVEMQYGMCKYNLRDNVMLKSQENINCHEPLSQECINGR